MEIYLSLRQVPGTFGVLFHRTGRSTVRREHFDAFLFGRLEVGFHGHHVTLTAGTALTQVQSSFYCLWTTQIHAEVIKRSAMERQSSVSGIINVHYMVLSEMGRISSSLKR